MERILAPGGLARLETRQLMGILGRLRSVYGRPTLAPLRAMSDKDAEAFLMGFRGVGAKVAKCVLMYSLDRQVLPVDVHVHRVAERLGLRVKRRPDTSQDLIENAVPPGLRYSFHVNAIAHGREVCMPRTPRCEECCVTRWCSYYKARQGLKS